MNKEIIREKLEKVLYDNAISVYDCTRVWHAWHYGTMTERDFSPLEDRVPEIAEEIMKEIFGDEEDERNSRPYGNFWPASYNWT